MKRKITTLLFALMALSSFAQDTNEPVESKKKFKFSGKPIVTLFADYKAGIGNEESKSGFNLSRAYLGYEMAFAKGFSAKVVLDFGNSKIFNSNYDQIAYVKNALLAWKYKNLNVKFGLIGLNQFSVQEKFWGYRFVEKSFQDKYKFGSSADLGLSLGYKFTKWLSADVVVSNGEGYKHINVDSKYRYSLGLTAKPIESITLRAYTDIYSSPNGEEYTDQEVLALFAGYSHKYFSIGAEFNQMWNSKFVAKQSQSGVSVYANVKLHKKLSIYGRYNNLFVKNNWADEKEDFVVGLQYQPIKQVKISPNFLYEKALGQKRDMFVRLSVEVKI